MFLTLTEILRCCDFINMIYFLFLTEKWASDTRSPTPLRHITRVLQLPPFNCMALNLAYRYALANNNVPSPLTFYEFSEIHAAQSMF